MAERKISAKTSKVANRVFEGTIDLHNDTLQSMVAWAGEDAVKSAATADMVISIQSLIRSAIERGKSDAEIQAVLNEYKPGVRTSFGPADPVTSIMTKFKAMTPEEQVEFQRDLIARLKEAKA